MRSKAAQESDFALAMSIRWLFYIAFGLYLLSGLFVAESALLQVGALCLLLMFAIISRPHQSIAYLLAVGVGVLLYGVANAGASSSPGLVATRWLAACALIASVLSFQQAGVTLKQVSTCFHTVMIPALLYVFLRSSYSYDVGRFQHDAIHPNLVGVFCFCGFMLASPRAMISKSWASVAIFYLALAYRFESRAPILAALVFICVYLWQAKGLFRQKLILVVLVGAALLAMFAGGLEGLKVFDAERGVGSGFSGRVYYWLSAWDLFVTSPWFGIGYGLGEATVGHPIDNAYLNLIVENGVLGAAIYISVVVLAVRVALRSRAQRKFELSFVVATLIYLVFERRYLGLGNPHSFLYVWILIFCIRGVSLRDRGVRGD